MEMLVLATLFALALHFLNAADQARRIVLLGRHLGQFRIEQLMEQLTSGYQRALAESDVGRAAAIWTNLHSAEASLSSQFARFSQAFAAVPEPNARVSRLPMAVPWATVWLAQGCFDMRKLLAIHAHGLARAAALPTQPHQAEAGADPSAGAGSGQGGGGVGLGLGAGDGGGSGEVDPDVAERERLCRQRARTLLAEILLMQHSCHWFCKSKTVASARLMARQRTSHEQVVASVTPETRSAYALLVGLPK